MLPHGLGANDFQGPASSGFNSGPPLSSLPPSPTGTTTTQGGGGQFTPDWASLIAGDPALLQAQAALNASGFADKNALGAEVANAYEGFGKPIDLAALAGQLGMSQADIGGYVGPDAQRIAQENTAAGLSTVARLDAANQLANHNITADLNRRGILNSGETGYQLDRQNLSYRQAQQDAYGKFLSYLQQYQSGYLAAQERRAEALSQAYSDAANRQFGLWGNSGGGSNGDGSTPSGSISSTPPGNIGGPSQVTPPQPLSGVNWQQAAKAVKNANIPGGVSQTTRF